jgi:hypothetical protein
MWSFFNLTVGFKFYFGKKDLEGGSRRFNQSRVETRKIFGNLSSLFGELSLKFQKKQEFKIEVLYGKKIIEINSRDIDFIELTTKGKNILVEIGLKNDQIVPITNASAVSIVYVDEAKPTKPRLDANAEEAQYKQGTIGSRLQEIFPNVNNLTVTELMEPSALEELQIGPNPSAVLVIAERDTLVNSIIEPEKFFQINIENQYQGTNLPNVWVLPMSTVKKITAVRGQNFILVEWVDGNPPDSRGMVFPLSEHRFFVIKEKSTTASPHQGRKSTAAAKPGSAEALAEPAKPKIVTLRDVLLSQSSLTNLDDINITYLEKKSQLDLEDLMKKGYKYLVIFEEKLLSGKLEKSSILGLRLTSKVSCHVIELSSINKISKNYLPNGEFFGFDVVWSEGNPRSLQNMIYPINNYSLVLIGIPETSGQNISEPNPENIGNENSDNGLLARLLQSFPDSSTN